MTAPALKEAALVAISLLVAMAVSSVLILIYGESPLAVYRLMLAHTWGDAYGLGQVLFKATPLIFTGLAVALAFRAGLFNIGAEGQLLVGSLLSGLVGAHAAGLPAPLAVVACLVAGAAGGAALGALPGWLKARFGAHEVINTIMLNFIVQALLLWAGRRFFFVEQTVHTAPIAEVARLPRLPGLGESAASLAFPLGIAICLAVGFLLERTRAGFELRAVGQGPSAAQAGGIAVGRVVVAAMTLSGAIAGLVGSGTVLGYKGYFEDGLGSGTGFMGIAVALLARSRPLAVVAAALLFGTLAQGGLAANALVPKEIIDVLQAVIILSVAATSMELRRQA